MKSILSLAGMVSVLLFSIPAATADPGDGVQSDSLKLRLGIDLLSGVNTNLFYEDESQTTPVTPLVRAQPYLSLSNLNAESIAFGAGLRFGWDQYLSSDANVQDQSGFTANANGFVHFNPNGSFSFRLEDTLQRTNDPSNKPSDVTYNRFSNRAGAVLGVHPGGRAIENFLSFHWNLIDYNAPLEGASNDILQLQNRFVYKFFPKTAFLFDADYRFVLYDQAIRGGRLVNNNSQPLRLRAGVNGLITNGLALRLLAGWGWGFYDQGTTFSSFLIESGLKYHFGPGRNSSVGLTYQRDFMDSMIGNFFAFHRIGLAYQQFLFDKRFSFNVKGWLEFRQTQGIETSGTTSPSGTPLNVPPELADTVVRADASLDYNFTEWFYAGLGYTYQQNITNDNVTFASGGDPDTIQGRDFARNIIMLKLGFQY